MKVTKGLRYYLDMGRVNMYCEKCAFNSGDNFMDWREDEKGRRYWMCPSCSRKNYPIDPPSFTPTKHLLENPESHQSHYDNAGLVQPIDIIVQYKLDFFEGSALKYLLRYKSKDGLKDLRKLEQYVHWLIARWPKTVGECTSQDMSETLGIPLVNAERDAREAIVDMLD